MERGVMLHGLFHTAVSGLWRFPAALGLALAASLAFTSSNVDLMNGALLAFPWAVALRLFSEARLPRFPGLLPWGAVLLALPFEGSATEGATSLMVGAAGLLAIVAALPQAWDRRANGLWAQGLLLAIVVAVAATVLVVAGWSLIFAILSTFFELGFFSRWGFDCLPPAAMLFGPWVALALWPRPGGEPLRWPSLAEGLLNWLLVPFTLACAALLNLYCLQIAVAGEIPKGVVAPTTVTLVLCGGGVWALACASEARAARWLTRWFWLLLLLPTVALMVAAWQRVAQYGLTEARYLLFLCAAVVVVMAGIQTVRRTLPTPSLAALVGSLALLLAAVGPWGATAVSVRSQFAGLLDALDRAGLMRDGRIPLRDPNDPARSVPRAASALRFLVERGRDDLVVERLAGSVDLAEADDVRARSKRVEQLATAMGLSLDGEGRCCGNGPTYVRRADDANYFHIGRGRRTLVDIEGYAYAAPVVSLRGQVVSSVTLDTPSGLLDIVLTPDGLITARFGADDEARFDLVPALRRHGSDSSSPIIVTPGKGQVPTRLILHSADWIVSKEGDVTIQTLQAQLLIGRPEK